MNLRLDSATITFDNSAGRRVHTFSPQELTRATVIPNFWRAGLQIFLISPLVGRPCSDLAAHWEAKPSKTYMRWP